MSRLVVISPHLDDAVFSCGTLIAAHAIDSMKPLVVTVCAGYPPHGLLTQLDAAAGFPSSREAVAMRRIENNLAVGSLGAASVHLDVFDAQYIRHGELLLGTTINAMNDRKMREQLEPYLGLGPDYLVIAPWGIRHSDHEQVATVCAERANWWYEELPYRVLWPSMNTAPEVPDLALPSCQAKERAIRLYASQIGDGPPGPELAEEERYHRVHR